VAYFVGQPVGVIVKLSSPDNGSNHGRWLPE